MNIKEHFCYFLKLFYQQYLIDSCILSLYIFSFRYQWEANAGTYYYNSFTGLQRMDGFAGRFFVRQPPEDEPHSKLYDYDLTEHSILVQQFAHRVMPPLRIF